MFNAFTYDPDFAEHTEAVEVTDVADAVYRLGAFDNDIFITEHDVIVAVLVYKGYGEFDALSV